MLSLASNWKENVRDKQVLKESLLYYEVDLLMGKEFSGSIKLGYETSLSEYPNRLGIVTTPIVSHKDMLDQHRNVVTRCSYD